MLPEDIWRAPFGALRRAADAAARTTKDMAQTWSMPGVSVADLLQRGDARAPFIMCGASDRAPLSYEACRRLVRDPCVLGPIHRVSRHHRVAVAMPNGPEVPCCAKLAHHLTFLRPGRHGAARCLLSVRRGAAVSGVRGC